MKKKKIKVFLDGYINSIRAQNLNCLALAKHLDPERFEVYTQSIYSGIDLKLKRKNVHVFHCRKPFRFTKYLGFLWGVWKSDIVYLNKISERGWKLRLIRLFGKKVFTTLEETYSAPYENFFIRQFSDEKTYRASWSQYAGVFALSEHSRLSWSRHGVPVHPEPLPLGVETALFANESPRKGPLRHVVFTGRIVKAKGIYDILTIARKIPDLHFHIIGEGEEFDTLAEKIETSGLRNVKLYGRLVHEEMAKLYRSMDLFLFPSRHSEGFPKVLLECSAAGIPFLTYRGIGVEYWAKEGENCLIAENLEEMIETIENLKRDPERLRNLSWEARRLGARYDWGHIIKRWESEIFRMFSLKS